MQAIPRSGGAHHVHFSMPVMHQMPIMPFSRPGVFLHANRKADMSSESCGMSRVATRAMDAPHAGANPRATDARIHHWPWHLTGLLLLPTSLRRGKANEADEPFTAVRAGWTATLRKRVLIQASAFPRRRLDCLDESTTQTPGPLSGSPMA